MSKTQPDDLNGNEQMISDIMRKIEPHRDWLEEMGYDLVKDLWTCEWLVHHREKED